MGTTTTNTQMGPPIFKLHGTTTSNTNGTTKTSKAFYEKGIQRTPGWKWKQKGVKWKSSTVNLKKTTQ